MTFPNPPTAGTPGTVSQVKLGALVVAQGDGGGGGQPFQPSVPASGADGIPGSGVGDAVTVGGGRLGGQGGSGFVDPAAGQDGIVEIRW